MINFDSPRVFTSVAIRILKRGCAVQLLSQSLIALCGEGTRLLPASNTREEYQGVNNHIGG